MSLTEIPSRRSRWRGAIHPDGSPAWIGLRDARSGSSEKATLW